MLTTSNRWFALSALLISSFLWLVASSVFANAIHILAKSNFLWTGFGSISIWMIAISFVWLAILTYTLLAYAGLSLLNVSLGFGLIALWMLILAAVTIVGDEFLGKLGSAAIIVWLIEVAFARLILSRTPQLSLQFSGLLNELWPIALTLTWIMAAKILALCLSPGVAIRI
ncbi:MAG: hypothetical protein V4568_19365 [Pseudomonadota bacterium]